MTTEFTAALHDSEYRITLAQPDLGNTLTLDAMR
jgi:enoyl-CoA hydratase